MHMHVIFQESTVQEETQLPPSAALLELFAVNSLCLVGHSIAVCASVLNIFLHMPDFIKYIRNPHPIIISVSGARDACILVMQHLLPKATALAQPLLRGHLRRCHYCACN